MSITTIGEMIGYFFSILLSNKYERKKISFIYCTLCIICSTILIILSFISVDNLDSIILFICFIYKGLISF